MANIIYDKPVAVWKQNVDTEKWEPLLDLHGSITRIQGTTPDVGGAEVSVGYLTIRFRWCPPLENDVRDDLELCKVVYRGRDYEILDYDDYHEDHETVKLQVRGCNRAAAQG